MSNDVYDTVQRSGRYRRMKFRGTKPNIRDYVPVSTPIKLSEGISRTSEKCGRCGVSYTVPVANKPTNVHESSNVCASWKNLGESENLLANGINAGSETSGLVLAHEGAQNLFDRSVRFNEQEEDNVNRHISSLRTQCREAHFCDPDIYVPPEIQLAYLRDVRDYNSARDRFEQSEDINERNFNESEYRYLRSRYDNELDRQTRNADIMDRDNRLSSERNADYLRSRADREKDRLQSIEDRTRQFNYELSVQRTIRHEDSEFGFKDFANFFFSMCNNTTRSPIKGSRYY